MRIFVANISFTTTEDELLGIFAFYGPVSRLSIAKEKGTERSRGFAFVDMPNDKQAQAAIEALHGTDFQGREIRLERAKTQEITAMAEVAASRR